MADNLLVVLVTGANQGIGYYAAQHFASTGKHYVLVGSRDAAKGQKAIEQLVTAGANKGHLEAVQIDLSSDDSIEAAVATVDKKLGRLDILVNNAAISNFPNVSMREEYKQLYDTNVFGTTVCTDLFVPLLKKSTAAGGKRIIFVSSSLGSLKYATDASDPKNHFPGRHYITYRSTKSALNMIMVHFADVLGEEGFTVGSICPGYCGTNLNYYQGTKDPSDGAKVILLAADSPREKVHAQVINENGALSW